MTVYGYVNIGIFGEYRRKFGKRILSCSTKVIFIGLKENAGTEGHLDSGITVLVLHIFNLYLFHIAFFVSFDIFHHGCLYGCSGFCLYLVHLLANQYTRTCAHGSTDGGSNSCITCHFSYDTS